MLGQQPLIELINAGQTLADGGQHLLFQAFGFLSIGLLALKSLRKNRLSSRVFPSPS
jgi:hypothetical protein